MVCHIQAHNTHIKHFFFNMAHHLYFYMPKLRSKPSDIYIFTQYCKLVSFILNFFKKSFCKFQTIKYFKIEYFYIKVTYIDYIAAAEQLFLKFF